MRLQPFLLSAFTTAALLFIAPANAAPTLGAGSVMSDGGDLVQQARHRWGRRHSAAPAHHHWRHHDYTAEDMQRMRRRGHLHRGWGPHHPHW